MVDQIPGSSIFKQKWILRLSLENFRGLILLALAEGRKGRICSDIASEGDLRNNPWTKASSANLVFSQAGFKISRMTSCLHKGAQPLA